MRDDPLYRLVIEDLDEFLTEETFPHLIDGGEQTIHEFMSLVVQCFSEDPYNRPTIYELVTHPFIAS